MKARYEISTTLLLRIPLAVISLVVILITFGMLQAGLFQYLVLLVTGGILVESTRTSIKAWVTYHDEQRTVQRIETELGWKLSSE